MNCGATTLQRPIGMQTASIQSGMKDFLKTTMGNIRMCKSSPDLFYIKLFQKQIIQVVIKIQPSNM